MKTNVTLVKADDWQGLYFDGELWMEGRELQLEDVLRALWGRAIGLNEIAEVDNDWMIHEQYLPKRLSDIPAAAYL